MIYFIKKYPFSIALFLLIVYLSFFKPPSVGFLLFPYSDKLVHLCMYGGVTVVLWIEFFINNRHSNPLPVRKALTGAVLCPVLFSGIIELGQNYLTVYRSGEWLDFLSNTAGVISGSLISWFIIRRRIIRK